MNLSKFLKSFPYFLILYHLVFAWFAYEYVNQNNGDAVKYWFTGVKMENLSWGQFLQPGTSAIYMISYPFVKFLKLSPLIGCFLFSAWSSIGFWRLWKLAMNALPNRWLTFFPLILVSLLPNVHFWTSLIGKEAFLFPLLVFFLEKMYQKQYTSWVLFLSLFAIFWVRPHLGLLLVGSFGIVYLFLSKNTWQWKAKLATILLGLAGVSYYLLGKITQAKEGLFQKVLNLYAAHNEKLKSTSAYVPLEEYPYPFKLFSFYFRPLPFEKSGFLYTVLAIENFISLILFGFCIYLASRNFKAMFQHQVFVGILLFLLVYGTVFGLGYANYGLIVRTKSLVFPFVFLAIFLLLNYNLSKNESKLVS